MTKISHPCISCRFIKVCGDKTRTEPCNGRDVIGRKVKGRGESYFKYEIANDKLKCVDGADTIEDARARITLLRASDKAHGFAEGVYIIFLLNSVTGERIERME